MTLEAQVAALLLAVADHSEPSEPSEPSEQAEATLAPDVWYARHHDRALALSSLQVVQLVDLIEATFELVLTSDDVVRAHFATPAAIVARLRQRGLA